MSNLPSAPRSFGEVMDAGFGIYAQCLPRIIGLTTLAALVGLIPELARSPDAPPVGGGAGALALNIVTGIVNLALLAAIIHRMQRVVMGGRPDLGEDLRLALVRLPSMIAGSLLHGLAVLIGLVLLVVPGLIVAISLMFWAYAIVIDDHGPFGALFFSHGLVWGDWWRTLGVVLTAVGVVVVLLILVVVLANVILAVLAGADALQPGSAYFRVAQAAISVIVGGIVLPIFYAISLAQYHDLKLRKNMDAAESESGH